MTTDLIAASAERFRRDTAEHVMTVLHDDGLYRHLRCAKPDSSIYWFEIVTWPGSLALRGDIDGRPVFSRLDDMFQFFRSDSGHINPQYWAEKLGDPSSAESYSEDRFREYVAEALAEAEAEYPGVTAAWAAHMEWNACSDFEDQARDALRDFEFTPDGAEEGAQPFRFQDTWEWDLTDWDWSYLWICHAIVWGIGQYDAARSQVETVGAAR